MCVAMMREMITRTAAAGRYKDYGGDGDEDPFLACWSLLVRQRESGSGRMIAGGRIVQVDPPCVGAGGSGRRGRTMMSAAAFS